MVSPVHIAAVTNAVNANHPDFVGNLVKHAIVSRANSPVALAAGQLL